MLRSPSKKKYTLPRQGSTLRKLALTKTLANRLKDAVLDVAIVSGLTHNFYRYPARFSPAFARSAIEAFTRAGDVVLDPFMGGGTSLVEAYAMGRHAIGIDINSLAAFVTRVKTTPLNKRDVEEVSGWLRNLQRSLNLRNRAPIDKSRLQYQRNIAGKQTWAIRKTIGLSLDQLQKLPNIKQQHFVRCGVLKTAQWALDGRAIIPSAAEFREKLVQNLSEMLEEIKEYEEIVRHVHHSTDGTPSARPRILNRSVVGIENNKQLLGQHAPALILTSPPYPGVHVLYHRWQVRGRRETPAPYWIANKLDGSGASFYTFGDRKEHGLATYYKNSLAAFSSLAKIANNQTLVVQLVAFSDRECQLPLYLEILKEAGFTEYSMPEISNSADGRLWRTVPNRKWFVDHGDQTSSSQEVVLFHRLSKQKEDAAF